VNSVMKLRVLYNGQWNALIEERLVASQEGFSPMELVTVLSFVC
jgi:hypothetical protein